MKTTSSLLYIMRHAEAAPDSGQDQKRILTDKGRLDSRTIGRKIMADFKTPAQMLVSSATRTRQTAACLALAPSPEMEISDRLYNGNEQTYLDEICRQTSESLLLIGHNPSVLQLLHRICKPVPSSPPLPVSFPSASLAVVEFSGPLYLCGSQPGRLTAFLTP